jgi:hypothetical protein
MRTIIRHVSTWVVPPRAATPTTRPQTTRRIGQRPLQAHGCWRLKAGFQCRIETIIRHVSTGVVPPRAATLTTRPQMTRRIGQRSLQAHGCWRLKAGFQCRIETIIRHVSTGVVPPRTTTLMTRPQTTRRIGQRPLQAHGCWRLKADTESWIKMEEHNKLRGAASYKSPGGIAFSLWWVRGEVKGKTTVPATELNGEDMLTPSMGQGDNNVGVIPSLGTRGS